jgi:voltage-gated potassium channel
MDAKKRRIFDIIQIGYDEDWQSRAFDLMLIVMILANLFIVIFSTFDSAEAYRGILDAVEWVTVAVFAVEYGLRVWTAEYLYPGMGKGRAVRKYITSFSGVIDMLSFLPNLLPFFFPAGLVAFRMFRVIRIFRLFRINAYYDALNVIGDVIHGKKGQILSSIFIIVVLMTASSLCMYHLEHEAQPEVFQNAFSGFWWAASTLLTVGYGDIYPITIPGRILGIMITFLGVGMVAIPTGILSAGFVEQYTRLKSLKDYTDGEKIQFIRLEVEGDHPWAGQKVSGLSLPPGLLMVVIRRQGRVLIPRGGTFIQAGDQVVLGAEGYRDEAGIDLQEIVLNEQHPWTNRMVKDLGLSGHTLIVMVRRQDKLLVPNGNFVLLEGDLVVMHTRKSYRNMKNVEV